MLLWYRTCRLPTSLEFAEAVEGVAESLFARNQTLQLLDNFEFGLVVLLFDFVGYVDKLVATLTIALQQLFELNLVGIDFDSILYGRLFAFGCLLCCILGTTDFVEGVFDGIDFVANILNRICRNQVGEHLYEFALALAINTLLQALCHRIGTLLDFGRLRGGYHLLCLGRGLDGCFDLNFGRCFNELILRILGSADSLCQRGLGRFNGSHCSFV